MNRIEAIRTRLIDCLKPQQLDIVDESNLHKGHTGHQGAGHFKVYVISEKFNGQSKLACHRLVYDAVKDLMQQEIHALTITAIAAEQINVAATDLPIKQNNNLNQLTTFEVTKALINRRSITPKDAGCQQFIAKQLAACGFNIKHLPFGDVANLWATHGEGAPLFVFAGHTDVVPEGQLAEWQTDPFTATVNGDYLYGRGAADMKSGIAAMMTAATGFIQAYPQHNGTIAFLITSDEEGPAINGTQKVIDYLNRQNIKIDWCVVGEPSSNKQLADNIRVGRRGSLNGKLVIQGIGGHVAYIDAADNPIHKLGPFLADLAATKWGDSNDIFPPTSFQVSSINTNNSAENVVPSTVSLLFNFRYSTDTNQDKLQNKIVSLLEKHRLDYQLEWTLSGLPFLTQSGKLIDATCFAISKITGSEPIQSTGGGTSDGRFIAPTGAEVVELGVINETIHKPNECVKIEDLEKLSKIYQHILKQLFK